MAIRTVEEAIKMVGVSKTKAGLNLHFSSIPNWYMPTAFDCPRCDNRIEWRWQWDAKIPMITNEHTPKIAKPLIEGASLITYAHRWINIECKGCGINLFCENFD